jgi:hypothetical protein
MILDKLAELSNAQAVTSADAYSDYSFDLGNITPKHRIGTGTPLSVVFVVTTAAAADGGSFTDTFDFIVVASANANLSSHVELIKRRIPGASLVAGFTFDVPIPQGMQSAVALRYLGARYELGTDDTISVSAYIVPTEHVGAWMTYAKGYSI